MNTNPKVLKKEIKRLWKSFVSDVEDNRHPDPDDYADLVRKCDDYKLYTESGWAGLWTDCCDKIKECYSSAKSSDFEKASELAKEIKKMKKDCHSRYKE